MSTSLPTISPNPTESASTIQHLLQANLFTVFNNRSSPFRTVAVESTYHSDVVWYETEGVVVGHDALNARAEKLLNGAPGFDFKANGEMAVCQNMGTLKWWFGPPEKPDLVQGIDVIIVEGGKIKFLWTALEKVPTK